MASFCPAVTVWPTVTSTAVTLPAAPNASEDWEARARLPEAETEAVTGPRNTVAVRVKELAEAEESAPTSRYAATPAPTRTTARPEFSATRRREDRNDFMARSLKVQAETKVKPSPFLDYVQ